MSLVTQHRALLRRLSLFSRLFFFLLFQLSALLPLFDASPTLVPTPRLLAPLLRWDLFHFLHIAHQGYVYEHEWAFFPGAPFLIRYSGAFIDRATGTNDLSHLLLGGAIVAVACDTSQTLYSLSLHHLQSPQLSLLASILSLLPTSPATLYFAPYNEPFFTYFSYRGMLCCTRKQWATAALYFALASTFRSNGIFLSGFILWGMLVHPFLTRKIPGPRTVLMSIMLTATVLSPFITYHFIAYDIFCCRTDSVPEWCFHFPPSIYTYIQSKYWNVGFLRYWTWSQLPNFLIAAPTLLLLYVFASYHLHNFIAQLLFKKEATVKTAFLNPSITPHVVHATLFSLILLFASHAQIVLRLGASMPLTYWAAAWLLSEYPICGSLWVIWSVLWGIISIFLWGAFLPPA